jgi:phosphoenolpyruvate-protein phosphotransferase
MPDPTHIRSTLLHGLPGAPGTAAGPVLGWRRRRASLTAVRTDDPLAQFLAARTAVTAQLLAAAATADATLAPLLDAQRLMLEDPELLEGIEAQLAADVSPPDAVARTITLLAGILEGASSAYFQERAIDVRAVGTLLIDALTGAVCPAIPPGAVIIAEELAPLDTAQLAEAGVAALVTVRGGPTCHAAIVARAWGLPAVVGAPAELLALADGTPVLVRGDTGEIVVHPTTADRTASPAPRVTLILSRRIPLYANAGTRAEVERAMAAGAEGIGLLRTEFLFQDRTLAPTEAEQVAEYTAIVHAAGGRPVIIRTLDIGADKPAPFLPLSPEANPQLGVRGIRLLRDYPDLLRTQLRALLRAGAAGPVQILLPMVSAVEEVVVLRALLAEEAHTLGLPLPPLGAMIEVPAAALAAPELAAVCDFFSLGTNDLLQFLLAADRQHAGVGYLHLWDHPGVWRLLADVLTAARAAGIPVEVCGEWGADPDKLPRLVDLGIDAVSVAVGALGRVRGWMAETPA